MTRNDIINGLEHCAVQAVDRDCDSCPVGFGEMADCDLISWLIQTWHKEQEART